MIYGVKKETSKTDSNTAANLIITSSPIKLLLFLILSTLLLISILLPYKHLFIWEYGHGLLFLYYCIC